MARGHEAGPPRNALYLTVMSQQMIMIGRRHTVESPSSTILERINSEFRAWILAYCGYQVIALCE